ncbi:MAG: glycosyltransferase family 9 protein [Bacteroidales bacterium]|nr:glycosyltransferase family 9 protein [Bacteroidales bacterium]
MHILVIRLSALGDVAMTIPAIYSVARTYPEHHFTVATSAFTARLFINRPANVDVLSLAKDEAHGATGTWKLIQATKRLDIDAVADLHNVLRSWLVDASFHLRLKRVVMLDKHRRERRAILHDHSQAATPFIQRYFDVFARLGLKAEPRFTTLFPDILPPLPPSIPAKATEQWIGIAPFARYRSKTYDQAQMKEVVEKFASRSRSRIFLFGARGKEEKILHEWAAKQPNVFVVAGRLQLEEELALMAHIDTMITMDSANMHMASLVGTRVVSLWGGTTPACGFLGYRQSSSDALTAGLSCQPCTIAGSDNCPLGHMQCTRAITTSQIVSIVLGE